MINETTKAERWNKALRMAQAKELRAVNLRLKRELSAIKREERLLYLSLFWSNFEHIVTVRYPQVFRWKLRKLFLNIEMFGIDCRLAGYKFFSKFSRQNKTPDPVSFSLST